MKNKYKNLFYLLLTGLFFLSCEKAIFDEETTESEDSNVTIHIGDIYPGWDSNFSRTLVNVSEVCSILQVAIYQNGKRIASKNQTKGDTGFGTFSLKLAEGAYKLLVLAHSAKKNITTTDPTKLQFTNPDSSNGTGFSDTFYYYGDIEVNADGAHIEVNMKRATSMFRLVTTDVKPEKVKKFWFYYEGGSGTLNAETGLGCVKSKQAVTVTLDDMQTGQPLQFDLYTFLHDETGKVTFTVRAFDEKDDIVYSREFTDVAMQRNRISRFTGNFFTTENTDPSENPDTPDNPGSSDNPDNPDDTDNPQIPDTIDTPEQPKDPVEHDLIVNPSNVIMVESEWGGIIDFTF